MQDIHPIYYNKFGITFQWNTSTGRDLSKIQMVFRDTGFLLTEDELKKFSQSIGNSLDNAYSCPDCADSDTCRGLLLDTPADQVSLVMSKKELLEINDLVAGTLFELSLSRILDL